MRNPAKISTVLLIGMLALGALTGAHAQSDNYPARNIMAVIPFAPGNANDITARIATAQPDDCVMKHIQAAVLAIKEAVQDLQMKLYKEALHQLNIAILEVAKAQLCPK